MTEKKVDIAKSEGVFGLVEAMKNPVCYPHPVKAIRMLETHISWVVLTGDYAYKIKKPVKFSFLDFSTLEKRHWFCEEEVRLNRRLAPSVYLGIVPITGLPSHPKIEGTGPPFEYAVKMRQFDPDRQFHLLMQRGECDVKLLDDLAERLGDFHASVDVAGMDTVFGTPELIWQPVEECLTEIVQKSLPASMQKDYERLKGWCHEEWTRLHPEWLKRKKAGRIRECHGDLHLRNIALIEGTACIFDALEFEPRLRWIDVMSEVAFLVMDIKSHGRPDLASWMLNRYLEITGEYEGLQVFRFYEVYRALVRAKVSGLRLNQMAQEHPDWKACFQEWIGYVRLAIRLSREGDGSLMLTHGVSGTGKTTVSSKILRSIAAIRVRSDVERRRIAKIDAAAQQPADSYTPAMTRATYERLAVLTDLLLFAGYSVIVDATFLSRAHRTMFGELALKRKVPFWILDISAPEAICKERIEKRQREGTDSSEATISVMRRQAEKDEPFEDRELPYLITIDSTEDRSIDAAIVRLSRTNRHSS